MGTRPREAFNFLPAHSSGDFFIPADFLFWQCQRKKLPTQTVTYRAENFVENQVNCSVIFNPGVSCIFLSSFTLQCLTFVEKWEREKKRKQHYWHKWVHGFFFFSFCLFVCFFYNFESITKNITKTNQFPKVKSTL